MLGACASPLACEALSWGIGGKYTCMLTDIMSRSSQGDTNAIACLRKPTDTVGQPTSKLVGYFPTKVRKVAEEVALGKRTCDGLTSAPLREWPLFLARSHGFVVDAMSKPR
jgi:hypothetical protein